MTLGQQRSNRHKFLENALNKGTCGIILQQTRVGINTQYHLIKTIVKRSKE
jgi:hypothetical protein